MKKMIILSLICINALAIDPRNIFKDLKNNIWGKINNATGNIAGVCYKPKNIGENLDICSYVNEVDNLSVEICQYAPNLPGLEKKNQRLGFSGLKSFCKAKEKEFENIASKEIQNIASNVFKDDKFSDKNKLPNGKTYSDHIKVWNVNNLLKDKNKNSLAQKLFLNDKNEELRLLMDYSTKSNNDIEKHEVANLKAPANLEEYKKNTFSFAKNLSENIKNTNSFNTANMLKTKISEKPDEANKIVDDYLATQEEQYELFKANEIGNALSLARDENTIAVPTQEYVNILRHDKKIEAIAKIRKQQLKEAKIISNINEKWNKIKEVNKIIGSKEIIMSMAFDEQSARDQIQQIVDSVKSSNSSSNFFRTVASGMGNIPIPPSVTDPAGNVVETVSNAAQQTIQTALDEARQAIENIDTQDILNTDNLKKLQEVQDTLKAELQNMSTDPALDNYKKEIEEKIKNIQEVKVNTKDFYDTQVEKAGTPKNPGGLNVEGVDFTPTTQPKVDPLNPW